MKFVVAAAFMLFYFNSSSTSSAADSGDGIPDSVRKYEGYFHQCYAKAKNKESLESAREAIPVKISDGADEKSYAESLDARDSLCEYAFKAVQQELPDDIRSFMKLLRQDDMCTLARVELINLRTALEVYYADNMRYPGKLEEAGWHPSDIRVKPQIAKGSQAYRIEGTHPECDVIYVISSDVVGIQETRKKRSGQQW